MASQACGALREGATGGRDWTVLVPTFVVAEWTALSLVANRTRETKFVGRSNDGVLPKVALDLAALLASSSAAASSVGEGVAVCASTGGGREVRRGVAW